MSRLFRDEAVAAAQSSPLGRIRLATPVATTAYTAVFSALLLAALVFVCTGRYTRRVTVSGEVTSTVGLVQVHAERASVVSRLLVQRGQVVKKGQPLVEYAVQQGGEDSSDVNRAIAGELRTQGKLAADERAGSLRGFDLKADDLRQRIAGLQVQRAALLDQRALLGEQIDVLRSRQARYERLRAQQYLSQAEFESTRKELISVQVQEKSMRVQISQLDEQLTVARNDLARLPIERRSRDNAIQGDISRLRLAVIEQEARRTWRTLSPVDGVVTALPVKAGIVVQAGQVMVAVLPANGRMEATLLINGEAAGFVEPKQRVLMRLDAFPYQKYGHLAGRVVAVDRNPTRGADLQGIGSAGAQASYYVATVALDTQSMTGDGRQHGLLPGMTCQADVMLERRRLVEWMLGPALGFGRKVMD
ncbi:HlyD family efflux transporter periplasmic adaptor subunit [Stenotrophomonas sp. HITSZ_GD]|uniref:HlyD family efflux transporter periplasmic adaptor subunit n=1 Tax=Stenotrophomonas sp. HITSZ_GD TaxID=3037248 RepID=UPI00240D973A|nr:HlyD family efflux transporter periplasmic adaptor subunit [Stenotrophomonas sp. HITSZ_GD]MDG2526276.1 HlyD family efflux transporter periplasmic adaptor subunit [Stenotrophomonas sp. HITSZ_GD]